MIITKEFIETILSEDIHPEVADFAHSFLVNLEHDKAMRVLGKRMDHLFEDNLLNKRNLYVPLYRNLRKNIDYGFKKGDKVEFQVGKRSSRVATILKVEEGNAYFPDLILPLNLVRKHIPSERVEQLELF